MVRVVAKFGGASIRSVKSIHKVAEIVRNIPEAEVIVASAFAGVTNRLSELFSIEDISEKKACIDSIIHFHESIASSLQVSFSSSFFKHQLYQSWEIEDQCLSKKKAQVLSVGEDMSQAILVNFFVKVGIYTESLCARTLIVTDTSYEKASPNLSVMKERWHSVKRNPDTRYLLQGFLGATECGETTLLGRGGSDYTAALVAEMIGADEVRLYKDVDGVYSIDPLYSAHAQVLPRLSFQEMDMLSRRGAKVVYPPTLLPCMRSNIPIRVLPTFDDRPLDLTDKGTLIACEGNNIYASDQLVITVQRHQILVFMTFYSVDNAKKVSDFLFSSADKYFVDYVLYEDNTYALVMSESHFSKLVSKERLFGRLQSLAKLHIIKNISTLSLLGRDASEIDSLRQEVAALLHNVVSTYLLYKVEDAVFSLIVDDYNVVNVASLLHDHFMREASPV